MMWFQFITRAYPNRAWRGLYGGRQLQFGNRISEQGGNKTRRVWKPNVQHKRLYSEILDEMVPLHVTTYALRCIIRMGGLDHYILKTPDKKLQSTKAQELRARLLARAQEMYEQQQTLAQQEGLIDAADVVEAYAEQGAGQAQDGDLGGDAPRPAASTS